jgi:hypothetical protein
VRTVPRGENCLFKMFHPFVTFEIVQNNVRKHIVILSCQLKEKRGEIRAF